MQLSIILSLGLCLLSPVLADFPSCDPDCQSCGLYCNSGCSAPLDYATCSECLYCRRESSSCAFYSLEPVDSSALCIACNAGCWCNIDAQCYDNTTSTATGKVDEAKRAAAASLG